MVSTTHGYKPSTYHKQEIIKIASVVDFIILSKCRLKKNKILSDKIKYEVPCTQNMCSYSTHIIDMQTTRSI